MARLISGKDVLALFREYDKRNTEDGTRIRFQSEVSLSEETSVEGTATTDGIYNTVSDGENTAEFTSLAYTEDTDTIELWKELKNFRRNNTYMEMWIIYNVGDTQTAEYMTGYITSFEMSASADGQVELSYSFAIDGNPIEGTETLTDEQLGLVGEGAREYRSVIAANNTEEPEV